MKKTKLGLDITRLEAFTATECNEVFSGDQYFEHENTLLLFGDSLQKTRT
jgi:hypothetical protein